MSTFITGSRITGFAKLHALSKTCAAHASKAKVVEVNSLYKISKTFTPISVQGYPYLIPESNADLKPLSIAAIISSGTSECLQQTS